MLLAEQGKKLNPKGIYGIILKSNLYLKDQTFSGYQEIDYGR